MKTNNIKVYDIFIFIGVGVVASCLAIYFNVLFKTIDSYEQATFTYMFVGLIIVIVASLFKKYKWNITIQKRVRDDE